MQRYVQRKLKTEERTLEMQPSFSKITAQLANFKSVQAGLSMFLMLLSLALAGCAGAKASGPPPKPPEVDVMEVV